MSDVTSPNSPPLLPQLAQVISSVTSSSGQLPNIDVSQKTPASASLDSPRHEPLVAGMSAASPQTSGGKVPRKQVLAGSETPEEIVVRPGETGDIYVTRPGSPKDDYVLTIAETANGEKYDMSVRKEGEGTEEHAAAVEKALKEGLRQAQAQAQAQAVEAAVEEAVVEAEAQAEAQAVQQAIQQVEEEAIKEAEKEELAKKVRQGLQEADPLLPEGRSGYVAYIPVPIGGEEKETTTTTTTSRPQILLVQQGRSSRP